MPSAPTSPAPPLAYERRSCGYEGKTSLRTIDREVADGIVRRQVATRWDDERSLASIWVRPQGLADSGRDNRGRDDVPHGPWLAIPPEEFAGAWSAALADVPSVQIWRVLSQVELLAARDTGWTGFGPASADPLISTDKAKVVDAATGPGFLAVAHVAREYLDCLDQSDGAWRLTPEEAAALDLFVVGPVVVVQQC